jgi:hypothetical protein
LGEHVGHELQGLAIEEAERKSENVRPPCIIDDRERKTFLLDREVLVSDDILRREMSRIFGTAGSMSATAPS